MTIMFNFLHLNSKGIAIWQMKNITMDSLHIPQLLSIFI